MESEQTNYKLFVDKSTYTPSKCKIKNIRKNLVVCVMKADADFKNYPIGYVCHLPTAFNQKSNFEKLFSNQFPDFKKFAVSLLETAKSDYENDIESLAEINSRLQALGSKGKYTKICKNCFKSFSCSWNSTTYCDACKKELFIPIKKTCACGNEFMTTNYYKKKCDSCKKVYLESRKEFAYYTSETRKENVRPKGLVWIPKNMRTVFAKNGDVFS